MNRHWFAVALTLWASGATSAHERCQALKMADFSNVLDVRPQITAFQEVPGAGHMPAYCRVEGQLTQTLEFEMRLPRSGWNGKFLVITNADTGNECNAYLRRGYACLPAFRTHKKGRAPEEWVAMRLKDTALRLDAVRATHLLSSVGKTIVGRYYAQAPKQSYLMGCSAGGHLAMLEAQVFPSDFDGIIAGAPHFDLAEWAMNKAWTAQNIALLSDQDIQRLHNVALDRCELDDGVQDGIIGNPIGCRFDPATLRCQASGSATCLTRAAIHAAKRLYQGPRTSTGDGALSPAALPGSELAWPELRDAYAHSSTQLYFELALYEALPPLSLVNFDFDRDYRRMGLASVVTQASNPDLHKFKRAGGKLLAYQGTNDVSSGGRTFADYYARVEKVMGGRRATQDFFRLFLIPGMGHCSAGMGPYAIDYLHYLEAWVERGAAPDVMIGAHIDPERYTLPIDWPLGVQAVEPLTPQLRRLKAMLLAGQLEFPLDPAIPVSYTRPVYPYPLYARYRGTGATTDAANFGPVSPDPLATR
jgi:hypothetical protein